MDALELNPEVFVARGPIVLIGPKEIEFVKMKAKKNSRGVCRILLHQNADDALHEMLIVHCQRRSIRPHKNVRSSKSYQVIEGAMDVLVYADDGKLLQKTRMEAHAGANPSILRFSDEYYHTLDTISDTVVFIETILGPFRGTTYAPWEVENVFTDVIEP